MAVTLPAFTIQDDAVGALVIDSFKGEFAADGTPLTPVQAYRRWLREQLIARVTYQRIQERRDARETADRLDLEAEQAKLAGI